MCIWNLKNSLTGNCIVKILIHLYSNQGPFDLKSTALTVIPLCFGFLMNIYYANCSHNLLHKSPSYSLFVLCCITEPWKMLFKFNFYLLRNFFIWSQFCYCLFVQNCQIANSFFKQTKNGLFPFLCLVKARFVEISAIQSFKLLFFLSLFYLFLSLALSFSRKLLSN